MPESSNRTSIIVNDHLRKSGYFDSSSGLSDRICRPRLAHRRRINNAKNSNLLPSCKENKVNKWTLLNDAACKSNIARLQCQDVQWQNRLHSYGLRYHVSVHMRFYANQRKPERVVIECSLARKIVCCDIKHFKKLLVLSHLSENKGSHCSIPLYYHLDSPRQKKI